MKVSLAYGKNGLEIEVPELAVVVEPRHAAGLADEKAAVLEALRKPIGSGPLREQVKPTDRVAIVISDITRPTPNHKLLPWLIEELPHVPLNNYVIINGTGTHRDQTEAELRQMLGG
jgi:nickel-dependent lactate racemase